MMMTVLLLMMMAERAAPSVAPIITGGAPERERETKKGSRAEEAERRIHTHTYHGSVARKTNPSASQ
jgi:hypothetical protein